MSGAGDGLSGPGSARSADGIMVVMPAFNEERSIGAVIGGILETSGYPVLVVDDASVDGTARVAREAGAEVLSLPVQLGAWSATQTGMRYAAELGCRVVVTMDADGQHLAESLAPLVAPVLSGAADVCIGACRSRGSPLRQVAWRMMQWTSRLALQDITSGLRAYNRAAFLCLAEEEASLLEYPDVGVLLLVQSRGLRITDVQVAMLPRSHGGSRVFHSWMRVMFYMMQTLLLGFSKRPLQKGSPAARPEVEE